MKTAANEHDNIAASLHSGLAKVSRQLRHMELPQGFTPERLRTLATIQANGPISVTALAAMEKVRPATVSRMISSLEDDGFIKRREDKTDKRGVLVSTTPKGRQMYLRANRQYLKHLNEALATLEPDQLELMRTLASLLEKLNTALDR
jgi:DNA-binding MarR family transcriptional regulator